MIDMASLKGVSCTGRVCKKEGEKLNFYLWINFPDLSPYIPIICFII